MAGGAHQPLEITNAPHPYYLQVKIQITEALVRQHQLTQKEEQQSLQGSTQSQGRQQAGPLRHARVGDLTMYHSYLAPCSMTGGSSMIVQGSAAAQHDAAMTHLLQQSQVGGALPGTFFGR